MGIPHVRRPRMRRTALILLVALATGAAALPGGAPPARAAEPVAGRDAATALAPRGSERAAAALRRALNDRLEGIRVKYGIPGVSVAVLFPDGSTWLGASGVADVADAIPVTADTAFAIASMSKTFTAALILALQQEGRLGLDVPAATYLPELDLDPAITVRQLMDHTSGLRDYFFHARIDAALLKAPDRRWAPEDALRYVGKPYSKPGRGWHYSNTNYLILGLLAERVGAAPLGSQLRARFFEPLGLSDTFYQPSEAPRGPIAHGYRFAPTAAGPIDLSDGSPFMPFTSVVTAAAGAGAVAASASDLARWARALYAGSVLPPSAVRSMVDDIARNEADEPTVPYGLGVQEVVVGGRPTLGHSGRLLGFRGVVRWLPREQVAIAVLTNQSRTDPGIIARALLKVALDRAPGCACADIR